MKKKLCRDQKNGMLFGVLSGIAKYFNVDVTLVRVVYLVLTLFSRGFPGVLLYVILALVLPSEDQTGFDKYDVE